MKGHFGFLKLIAFAGLVVCAFQVRAQTEISGSITDAQTGEALPFVNVAFKNGRVGTTTDENGRYSINTNFPTDSIIASYVGYVVQTRAVVRNKKQVIDFHLTLPMRTCPSPFKEVAREG